MNPAHYTYTAIFMWNCANYTDKCYTNIHTQCTNNCQLQFETSLLIILLSSCITSKTSRLNLESGIVPGNDLSMYPIKMPAVFWAYMFLQSIFIMETNNYTKRICLTHTDHYSNTRAMKWKKLTTKELNTSKTCTGLHRWETRAICIVLGPITFPRDNFQINLTCFDMVAKKDFATVLDGCWRSVVFMTPPIIWPQKRQLVSAE
jgi:hypothetical protein